MELANYLNFDGTCEAAFKHYEKLLGGKIEFMMRFGEGPPEACGDLPAEARDKIMHVRMRLGQWALMGSDAPHGRYEKPQGNWVSLSVDSAAEAERIYKGLSDNAKIVMPLDKTFWAEKFGMLVDRFGTPWMINCEAEQS
ncbi:MAG TPA: VOC family protein [Burkholderiales bacterium]|nr:VOC family protein [Burkholderiales bacterium]